MKKYRDKCREKFKVREARRKLETYKMAPPRSNFKEA